MVTIRRRPTGKMLRRALGQAAGIPSLPGGVGSAGVHTRQNRPLLWRGGGPAGSNTIAAPSHCVEHIPAGATGAWQEKNFEASTPAWDLRLWRADLHADDSPKGFKSGPALVWAGLTRITWLHVESPHGQRCQARRCQA